MCIGKKRCSELRSCSIFLVKTFKRLNVFFYPFPEMVKKYAFFAIEKKAKLLKKIALYFICPTNQLNNRRGSRSGPKINNICQLSESLSCLSDSKMLIRFSEAKF